MRQIARALHSFSGSAVPADQSDAPRNPATTARADTPITRSAIDPNMPPPVGNRQDRTRTAEAASVDSSPRAATILLRQQMADWCAQVVPHTDEARNRERVSEQILNNCAHQTPDLKLVAGEMTYLPSCLAAMTWLRDLTIHGKNLTALPPLPQGLMRLDASDNQLTALPPLPQSLTSVFADNNQLTGLPPLPQSLTTLHANNNQLTALPPLPQNLTRLDASNNQLTALPPLPQSLMRLFASSNQLTVLPPLPQSLMRLDIRNNQLTTLPPLPQSLTWLTTDPDIVGPAAGPEIPPPVGNSQAQTPIAEVPSVTSSADTAKILLRQQLTEWVARAIPNTVAAQDRKHVSEQILNNCESQAPDLKLATGELTTLPSCLAGMTWLQKLKIDGNQLTTLPTLPQGLTVLSARVNQLTSLPTLPQSLTVIYAHNNQLTTLPTLPQSLAKLFASNNQLTILPTLPQSLTRLNANNNQLTTLPTLPQSLTWLDANNNQLTTLPTLPQSLTTLNASNNPQINIPAHIALNDTAAVRQWQTLQPPQASSASVSLFRHNRSASPTVRERSSAARVAITDRATSGLTGSSADARSLPRQLAGPPAITRHPNGVTEFVVPGESFTTFTWPDSHDEAMELTHAHNRLDVGHLHDLELQVQLAETIHEDWEGRPALHTFEQTELALMRGLEGKDRHERALQTFTNCEAEAASLQARYTTFAADASRLLANPAANGNDTTAEGAAPLLRIAQSIWPTMRFSSAEEKAAWVERTLHHPQPFIAQSYDALSLALGLVNVGITQAKSAVYETGIDKSTEEQDRVMQHMRAASAAFIAAETAFEKVDIPINPAILKGHSVLAFYSMPSL